MSIVATERGTFESVCQHCVWETHPDMLTGYCLKALACDRCGRVSDLAMTKRKETQ